MRDWDYPPTAPLTQVTSATMAVAGLGPKRKQQKKESLRQRLSTSPKASPPTVFAFNNPLPSQSSLPPEMAFLQQLELLCFTASQGDFYWPSTISARAKTMVPATTYTMLQKITPTCHTVYFPSCMGHPNPPKSFTFCYILSAEELIWKCKVCRDLLRPNLFCGQNLLSA